MVYPRISVWCGEWLNRKHDACDEEHYDLIGTVQQYSNQLELSY